MHLHCRVEQILLALRSAFNYEPTYVWFVLLMWGVLLANHSLAISSYLNAVGLPQQFYNQALHWFHSQAWSAQRLCTAWKNLLVKQRLAHHLHGKLVYVGDGIKVAKEGNQMPGVKRLHQEFSNVNNNKREWVRGHYFGALTLLLAAGSAMAATPVALELHDGLKSSDSDEFTLVDKMATQCVTFMKPGSYAVLDAFFAAANLIEKFRVHGLHLITRVRITSVGKAPFCARPGNHGPGCPRKWGADVKLRELFENLEQFSRATVRLYGKSVMIRRLASQVSQWSPSAPAETDVTLEGDEVYTRVGENLPPSASEGWTLHFIERESRYWVDALAGHKTNELFENGTAKAWNWANPARFIRWFTDGERRYGTTLWKLASVPLKSHETTREYGRRKVWRHGLEVAMKIKGSQGNPRVEWVKAEHPFTALSPEAEVHANHNEAHNAALRPG